MDSFNLKTFQDEYEENTKIITSKHMFNASLKEHCMNTIIDSLRMSSKTSFDLQRLADLPLVLRQQLLKKLCDDIDNKRLMRDSVDTVKLKVRFRVACLIIEQICMFNFKCLQPTRSDEFVIRKETGYPDSNAIPRRYEQQIFALLVQKCRKSLLSLIQFTPTTKMCASCTDFVYPALLGSLLKLDNLQHLELTRYAFRKSEFALLGSKLVNLVYLNCNVVDPTPTSLSEGLKPMKKLQVFIFSVAITDFEFKMKNDAFTIFNGHSLYQICMKEFPHLKVVGENLNGKLNSDAFWNFQGVNQSFGAEDDTLYGPRCRSQLEHLILGVPISQGQVQWHSNVTTLRIVLYRFEDMKDIENLQQLKNVKSLILNGPISSVAIGAAIIRRFLQVFGPNLNSLCITSNSQGMSFWEILSLCPDLTTLSMDEFSQNFDSFGAQIDDVQPFKNLTKIYFGHLDVSQNPEMLVHLFTAPKLEHLELEYTRFSATSSTKALRDLEKMQGEAIAPRLTTLILKMPLVADQYEECLLPKRPKYYNEYILLIQFVCSKAPLLKKNLIQIGGFSDNLINPICPFYKRARII